MGTFNQHSDNQPQQQRFLRGIQGSPGVGFSLTKDGNYDMVNKKLKNVGEGVESSDAVTKHQSKKQRLIPNSIHLHHQISLSKKIHLKFVQIWI